MAWNVYLPVPHAGIAPLSTAELSQVEIVVERLRTQGLTEIRLMDRAAPTVFITAEGYVRDGEFEAGNSGDLRRSSLAEICGSY